MSQRGLSAGAVRASLVKGAALLLACIVSVHPGGYAQEAKSTAPPGKNASQANEGLAKGRQTFESRCSGCHGLDGRGGERAPDIATTAKTQRRSDTELAHIIENGIPAAGMPAFSMLDSARVRPLIEYVRLLQGKTQSVKVPGDPRNGQKLFEGKARCSECHVAEGSGGFIASDLSGFGRTHSVEEIREAITKPSAGGRESALAVVTTRDGQKHSGVVRNEDNFSLQLQNLDGGFVLLLKPEIDTIARQSTSLMPADYKSKLSSSELDDLASFLILIANNGSRAAASEKKSFRDEEE